MWGSSEQCLIISPQLSAAYIKVLRASGLERVAIEDRPNDSPVGGLTQEQTDIHFAHAFDGSVARVQLAMLDPYDSIEQTSSTILKFLTGGGLCLADIPCGAGAGALSMLCTLAELREQKRLPRLPINVHLIGGEISAPARIYAEKLILEVERYLKDQAIFLTYDLISWDILSDVSTTNLIEKIVVSKHQHPQTLILIANFHGFLEREGKKKEASPQLDQIIKYSSGPMNAAIWIEPNMSGAKNGLFPWLTKQIGRLASFVKQMLPDEPTQIAEAKFRLPVSPTKTAIVRLRVMPLDLTKEII